ncbi:Outward-rectifier potassium channel TOK1 [Leucoagaricus sp. SymC.cos]|nr:Outward-rectifier potassium channel TOK1 [Leucoagaricus sp. SymC.cos]
MSLSSDNIQCRSKPLSKIMVVYLGRISVDGGNFRSRCKLVLNMWIGSDLACNQGRWYSCGGSWMVHNLYSFVSFSMTICSSRLLALNIISLVLAILANLLLLFNFAKRIPYRIAQPFTITFWYLSFIFLLIPICIAHTTLLHESPTYTLSQSYYYAFIACILYFIISTLLLLNVLGASKPFQAYSPSFSQLSTPQRTLMLQTILFSTYLALMGGVFAAIEGWDFVDGVYWADYTLLTIGFGSDFPVMRTAGRMLLLPFAAVGIVFVGLIVSSVRALVLERGKARITKRRLEKERERWEGILDREDEKKHEGRGSASRHLSRTGTRKKAQSEKDIKRFFKARQKFELKSTEAKKKEKIHKKDDEHRIWRRHEFELMRYIERSARKTEGYIALAFSVFIFVLVWIGGSLVFWACELNSSEQDAHWTYPISLYFSYVALLTIGYGDFYPSTTATRPFFVIWSLVAVPAVTILITTMGETVIEGVKEGVVWLGRWSLLPEKIGRQENERDRDVERAEGGRFSGLIRRRGGRKSAALSQQPIHPATDGDATQREGSSSSIHSRTHATEGTQTQGDEGQVNQTREEATQTLSPPSSSIESVQRLPLSIRLAREIYRVSKDASQQPPIQYDWHEWVRWLQLMDEAGETLDVVTANMTGRGAPLGRLGGFMRRDRLNQGHEGDCRDVAATGVDMVGQISSDSGDGVSSEAATTSIARAVDIWKWTWLDDQGPLFSAETETQWVLNKLCLLLEKVVERGLESASRRA